MLDEEGKGRAGELIDPVVPLTVFHFVGVVLCCRLIFRLFDVAILCADLAGDKVSCWMASTEAAVSALAAGIRQAGIPSALTNDANICHTVDVIDQGLPGASGRPILGIIIAGSLGVGFLKELELKDGGVRLTW